MIIGKIYAELDEIFAKKCRLTNYSPSSFQISYSGCKGVVAVDPTSSDKLSRVCANTNRTTQSIDRYFGKQQVL